MFSPPRISEIPYECASLSIDRDYLVWRHVHFRTIRLLKTRNAIYITKPDKGAGVVILNKRGYINKMNVILGDMSFRLIGPSETYDLTNKLKVKLDKRLLSVYNRNILCKTSITELTLSVLSDLNYTCCLRFIKMMFP